MAMITLLLALTMPIGMNVAVAGPPPQSTPGFQPAPTPPKASEPASPGETMVILADCNTSLQINPFSATAYYGQRFTVNVYWACQDVFDIYINMHWGNEAFEQYHCLANCQTGSTSFSTIFWNTTLYYSNADIINSSKGGYASSRQNVITP